MKADKMSKETILENFERNTQLMLLHKQTIPDPIQEQMLDYVESSYNSKIDINRVSDMKRMLEGTPYIEVSNTTKTYGDFGNTSTDMSFIKDDNDSSKPLF
jgi:hypothetical protein